MAAQDPRPKFDLCFFDAGHTWDVTGFGFVLVDILLRPGGCVILDDLDFTIGHKERSWSWKYSEDEKKAKGVRMVWDILVPHLGYVKLREESWFGWGVAQKPHSSVSLPKSETRSAC